MVLRFRSHPIVSTARTLARQWYPGHEIDDTPAMAHALKVATLLSSHVRAATPELLAAGLLLDSPDLAPRSGVDNVDQVLAEELSGAVARIVRVLATDRQQPGAVRLHSPAPEDLPALLVHVADTVIALESTLNGADRSRDPGDYWDKRAALLAAAPEIRDLTNKAAGVVPRPLGDALRIMVIRIELVARRFAPAV